METNRTDFRAELEALINLHSKESGSDTPDFILADYMADCLEAYDKAVTRRTEWYKPEPKDSPNMEQAIISGDWVVDGACDPDSAMRQAEKLIKEHGLTKNGIDGSWQK